MKRTQKDRMLAGELYDPSDPEIQSDQEAAQKWLARYNARLGASAAERHALLVERLASLGDGADVRPPFHCDYGFNIHLGRRAFLNFNCVVLDVVEVMIGDGAQIGPGVQILTADHPRDVGRGPRDSSSGVPSGSGATSGSARGRSSCQASLSATAP